MKTLDRRAIGIGVAIGLGASMLFHVLFRAIVSNQQGDSIEWIIVVSWGCAALIDLACGATAGALARRSGALHGFIAGLVSHVLGIVIGFAMMVVEQRGLPQFPLLDYFIAVLGGFALGIVLTTLAGAIAAAVAVRIRPTA